jgi:hypothetical protein
MHTLLPSRVSHQVPCAAPPPDVWAALREPRRWSDFEPFLARVEGAAGYAVEGQRLVGVARGWPLRIPLDVRRVVPRRALHVTVHVLPGLREEVDFVLLPATHGGTEITLVVRVSGPLATAALIPLWFSSAITARLLARAAEREQRRRLREASGVA